MRLLIASALMIMTAVSGTAATAATSFHIVERPDNETAIDLGAKGDSMGDLLAFANKLYDPTNQQVIGSSEGSCIRTIVGKSWDCNFTLMLAKGQLTVHGVFADEGDSLFAVTGGTGSFRGARGSLALTQRPGKEPSYDFAIVLQ